MPYKAVTQKDVRRRGARLEVDLQLLDDNDQVVVPYVTVNFDWVDVVTKQTVAAAETPPRILNANEALQELIANWAEEQRFQIETNSPPPGQDFSTIIPGTEIAEKARDRRP